MSQARVSLKHDEQRARDYWSVNVAERWEIVFWAREFRCSEAELRQAVAAVGKTAGNVRAHLLTRRTCEQRQ